METQIRVIGQEDAKIIFLDLADSQPITANYQFKDIQDAKANKGAFTFTFRVPSTSNNETFFNNYFEVTQQGNFNPKKKVKATIIKAGVDVLDGFLQLKNVYKKSNNTFEYECIVFSGVSTLGQVLKGKQLNEFDFSAYDHTMDANFVKDSMNQSQLGGDIVYSIYDYGQGIIGGQTEGSCQFPINPLQSINSAPTNPLLTLNLKPQIRIKAVLKQILEESGFAYTSDFIDTTMSNLYMDVNAGNTSTTLEPNFYLVNAPAVGTQTFLNIFTQTTIEFDDTSNPDFANLSNSWAPTSGEYTPTGAWETSSLDVSVTITCPSSANGSTFQIGLYNLTDEVMTSSQSNIATIFNGTATATIDTFGALIEFGKVYTIVLVSLSVTSLVTYTVSAGNFNTNPLNSEGSTSTMPNPNGGVSTIIWPPVAYDVGLEFLVGSNMPSIKAIDFITSLCKKFNLIIVPDKNTPTHLYIEPYSNWINEGENIDWTEKLDLSKDVQLMPTADLQAKTLTFTDAESEDFMNASFQSQTDRIYGTQLVDNSDSDFGSDKDEIKTIFTPTITSFLPESNDVKYTRCYSVDGEDLKNSPAIRLSFYCGLVSTGAQPIHIVGDGQQTLTSYALFQNYKDAVITPTTECLSFMNEASGNLNHPLLVNGAYTKYWKQYISETYNREARILKANFLLDTTDISNLSFNDIVYVQNAYFRINKIQNYSLVGTSNCQVELIKVDKINILDQSGSECELSPVTITFNGIVNFALTGTTSPLVTPTQSCCEAYGYNWSGNKCTQVNLSGGGTTGEVADTLEPPNKIIDQIPNGGNTDTGHYNETKGKSNLVNGNHSNINGVFNYISSTSHDNTLKGNANFLTDFVSNSNVVGNYNLISPYRLDYEGTRVQIFSRQQFSGNSIAGDFAIPLASGESLVSGGADKLYNKRGRSASGNFVKIAWTKLEEIVTIGQQGVFDISNTSYYTDVSNNAFRMDYPSMLSFEITIVGHNRGTIQNRSQAFTFRKYNGTIQNTNNSGNVLNRNTTIEIQKESAEFTDYTFKIIPVSSYFDGTNYYADGMFYFVIDTNKCTKLDNVDWTIDVKYTLVGLQNLSRSSGSQTFSPTSISGCVLWLDANNYSSIVFDGTSTTDVEFWNDLSGNGNNVKASQVNQYPTYEYDTNGAPLPHLKMDGVKQGFSVFTTQMKNVPNSDNTLFVVYESDTPTTAVDGSIVVGGTSSGSQSFGINVNASAPSFGSEICINPTMDPSIPIGQAGSGWYSQSSGGGATTFTGGGLKLTRGTGGYTYCWLRNAANSQSTLIPTKTYQLKYEVISNVGVTSFRIYRGGTFQTISNGVGSYTITFTQGTQTSFMFTNQTSNSNITIDNVSIKELIGTTPKSLSFLNNSTKDFSNNLDVIPSTTRQVVVGKRQGASRTVIDQLGNTNTQTNSANVVPQAYVLGGISYIGGSFLDPYKGKIYEVIQYNVLLTDSEIEEVTNYLTTKWNTLI